MGFSVGAGAVAALTGDDLLAEAAAWIVGGLVAVAFAALAYLYFEVSVAVAMAGVGFMLGSSLMVALGVQWTWLIILVGVIVALGLGLVAILGELPMIILTILTAMAGAGAMVGGLMLLVGTLDAGDLDQANAPATIGDDAAWWLLYALIAVLGVVAQARVLRASERTLRQQWVADGGRQFRSS